MILTSHNPATGEKVWSTPAATSDEVTQAVANAGAAFPGWLRRPLPERQALLRSFAAVLEKRRLELAEAISKEVGKPSWEALGEVQSMIAKIEFSIQAYTRRCSEFAGGPAVTRFKPHGIVAVFGPFNFPGHLPNGHIVPALLAGNTVVFKPSEHAPLVAHLTHAAWREAGLPSGVINLVHGGRGTGAALARHPGIDGLFFTGSSRTGLWLLELFSKTPEKILALEMGGNNPLVVWNARDHTAAALIAVQSAYLTAGQRCTCARRLIVPDDAEGKSFLEELIRVIQAIRVGAFTDSPEPFMGPVISGRAAREILEAQDRLQKANGETLVAARPLKEGTGLLSPSLIDVTAIVERGDEEIFGPLLQVIRASNYENALFEANQTCYGLSAGLISDEKALYEEFRDRVKAGLINWNQPLTGASGAAPFGGAGRSGNHRTSGFFAADYCSYPVASIEVSELKLPGRLPPGIALQS